MEISTREKTLQIVSRYVIITLSISIMTIGVYFFKFPNNFVFGGVTGGAALVAKLTPLSASAFSSCANILLLILGWIFLGKDFAISTGWATVVMTAELALFEKYVPLSGPLSDQPMLDLVFAIALPEPIYTPSTKAEIGDHDENISYEQSIDVLEKLFPGKGEEYATKLRDYTIALYKKCAEYALSRGIIIADTKFEFGLDEEGNVILGDEMLTPDSSRFWPLEGYEAGHGQPSFDKQFVRNWLLANPDSDYDLPQDVIDKTIAKYEEAYEMLTGKKL